MVINLNNLRIKAHLQRHYPDEISNFQDIIVSISVKYSPEEIPKTLASAIDYVKLEECALHVIEGEKFDIIEALAEKICSEILRNFPIIEEVLVRISKENVVKIAEIAEVVITKSQNVNKIILSCGTNLGNRLENLKIAYQKIQEKLQLKWVKISSVYETPAWFPDEFHPEEWNIPYYNISISGFCNKSSEDVLNICQNIEVNMGRLPKRERYSPREIDIDLLYFSGKIIANNDLQVPHSRVFFRDFMLIPAMEIEPSLFISNIKNNTEIAHPASIFSEKITT